MWAMASMSGTTLCWVISTCWTGAARSSALVGMTPFKIARAGAGLREFFRVGLRFWSFGFPRFVLSWLGVAPEAEIGVFL